MRWIEPTTTCLNLARLASLASEYDGKSFLKKTFNIFIIYVEQNLKDSEPFLETNTEQISNTRNENFIVYVEQFLTIR